MAEFGDLSGIVVNRRTGNMVGGHQRVKNLDPEWQIHAEPMQDSTGTVAAGHIETPWGRWTYREVEWPEEKEKAANIAANKHGGEWDQPKLEIVIDELKQIDFDIELTGFDFDDESLLDHSDDPPEDNYAEQYGVIVVCNDERHQAQIYDKLKQDGLNCKVVNT